MVLPQEVGDYLTSQGYKATDWFRIANSDDYGHMFGYCKKGDKMFAFTAVEVTAEWVIEILESVSCAHVQKLKD